MLEGLKAWKDRIYESIRLPPDPIAAYDASNASYSYHHVSAQSNAQTVEGNVVPTVRASIGASDFYV